MSREVERALVINFADFFQGQEGVYVFMLSIPVNATIIHEELCQVLCWCPRAT